MASKTMVKLEHSATRAVASRIERGLPAWLPLRAAEALWVRLASLARPLHVPRHIRVSTVGGAVLGGSGKTPVAVAITKQMASVGARVALVSHAHGAVGFPSIVQPSNDAGEVGDEALSSAEALGASGARVVSARRRQDAVDLVSGWAEVLVIDGPLQIAPRRADLAVLALSLPHPWGAGACPPLGDQRALPSNLVQGADIVVFARWKLTGARYVDGQGTLGIDELRAAPIGLITTLARPGRVLASLKDVDLYPVRHVAFGDHARVTVPPRGRGVDLWLAPSKTRPLWPGLVHGQRAAWLCGEPMMPRLDLRRAYP